MYVMYVGYLLYDLTKILCHIVLTMLAYLLSYMLCVLVLYCNAIYVCQS